jgi:hypothetical protein
MKITPLLIGACLLPVVTGCHKPSSVIGRAETAIKSVALAAITAKYPNLGPSDLKFSDLTIRAKPNGSEEIYVTYDIPASAKTTTEGNKATTTTEQVEAVISPSGEVEDVVRDTSSQTYNVAQ